MSTVRADNFGNRAGTASVSADTVLKGTGKAWANLNGTGTIAERDSYNVSSYVDNGTGDYTANLVAALGSGSASAVNLTVAGTSLQIQPSIITGVSQGIITTTSFRAGARIASDFVGNANVADVVIWSFTIVGDP